jgi:hypothetical protein
MGETATAKPYEHPPSRIPVPISRRASLNPDSLVLQQSSSIHTNGGDGRPSSASGSHKTTARPTASRRQSLLLNSTSRKTSFGEKNRDPGGSKSESQLMPGDQAELRDAYRRSTEIFSSELAVPSAVPSTDGVKTPTTRLANLPEDDVSPGAANSPLPPSVTDVDGSRIPRRRRFDAERR